MRIVWLLVVGALFVGALSIGWNFRANNAGTVDLDLIWFQLEGAAVWRVLVSAVGLGAGVATLLVGFVWLRSRLMLAGARSRIKKLEKQVHELRSLPLQAGSEPAGKGKRARARTAPAQPETVVPGALSVPDPPSPGGPLERA